jgi:hypothetical protein
MSHESICSLSEPWVLLPQAYAIRPQGSLSEYSNTTAYTGITDFIDNLPNGRKDYLNSLSQFLSELYEKQCREGEVYFLDKTPRYYLIIDEIVEIFPNAKFIFLFRSPIQIMASIVNTWGKGRFNKLLSNYYDITEGMSCLSNAYLKYKNQSHFLNYEDFVKEPKKELKKIFDYLELSFNEEILNEFSQQNTKGRLGDPTGSVIYSKISTNGLNNWKSTFNSIVRKQIALRLLNKLNTSNLEVQGYNKEKIISEIKGLDNKKNSFFLKDSFDYLTSHIVRKYNINLFMDKSFSWIRKKYMS